MTSTNIRQYIAGYTIFLCYPIRCRVTKASALEFNTYRWHQKEDTEIQWKNNSKNKELVKQPYLSKLSMVLQNSKGH